MKYVEVKSRLMDLGFTSLEAERLYGLVMGPGPRYSS